MEITSAENALTLAATKEHTCPARRQITCDDWRDKFDVMCYQHHKKYVRLFVVALTRKEQTRNHLRWGIEYTHAQAQQQQRNCCVAVVYIEHDGMHAYVCVCIPQHNMFVTLWRAYSP